MWAFEVTRFVRGAKSPNFEAISLLNSFELFEKLRFRYDSESVEVVIRSVTIGLAWDIASESVMPREGSPEFVLFPRFPEDLLLKSGSGRFAWVGSL